MLGPALALLLAAAPAGDLYLTRLGGVPVGTVRLALDGGRFSYQSDLWLRRGPALTHATSRADASLAPDRSILQLRAECFEAGSPLRAVRAEPADGALKVEVTALAGAKTQALAPRQAIPSSLAFAAFGPERRCLPVVEETTGKSGEACGQREGDEVRGKLLGERFVARMVGERLERLELPGQRASFERIEKAPQAFAPPDLYSGALAAKGLRGREEAARLALTVGSAEPVSWPATSSQAVRGSRVEWSRPNPPTGKKGWKQARRLVEEIDRALADKRPGPHERSPERALAEGRGACVAHTEAFLLLARREGLPARRALGWVAAEGRLWPHAWPQVEIAGVWYDVDPTEGAAPARSVRIALAVGEGADDEAALRLVGLTQTLKIEVGR